MDQEETPPEGFEPQVEPGPVTPEITETPADLISEADHVDQGEADEADDGSAPDDED